MLESTLIWYSLKEKTPTQNGKYYVIMPLDQEVGKVVPCSLFIADWRKKGSSFVLSERRPNSLESLISAFAKANYVAPKTGFYLNYFTSIKGEEGIQERTELIGEKGNQNIYWAKVPKLPDIFIHPDELEEEGKKRAFKSWMNEKKKIKRFLDHALASDSDMKELLNYAESKEGPGKDFRLKETSFSVETLIKEYESYSASKAKQKEKSRFLQYISLIPISMVTKTGLLLVYSILTDEKEYTEEHYISLLNDLAIYKRLAPEDKANLTKALENSVLLIKECVKQKSENRGNFALKCEVLDNFSLLIIK